MPRKGPPSKGGPLIYTKTMVSSQCSIPSERGKKVARCLKYCLWPINAVHSPFCPVVTGAEQDRKAFEQGVALFQEGKEPPVGCYRYLFSSFNGFFRKNLLC